MECPKCKSQMKCSGVSDQWLDWVCPECYYQRSEKKEEIKQSDEYATNR